MPDSSTIVNAPTHLPTNVRVIRGTVAVRWGMRLALLCILLAGGVAAAENRAVVFVIDRALSAERIEVVRTAFEDVTFRHGDRVGIVAFGATATVVRSIAGGPSRSRIVPTSEPTNALAGLEAARAMAKRVRGATPVFVVVTDGAVVADDATAVAPKRHDAVRLRAAFQRAVDGVAAPDAFVFVIDRGLHGAKLEAAKELVRNRLEALAPTTFVGVIAFDTAPLRYVRLQRAANRMRIANDVARITSGRTPSDPAAALRDASTMFDAGDFQGHVVLVADSPTIEPAVRRELAAIRIEAVSIRALFREPDALRMR